jgi:hypothetical protein
MSRSQWRSVFIVALRLVITLLFVPAIPSSSETPARGRTYLRPGAIRRGVRWSLALSKSLHSRRYGFQPSLHRPAPL